MLLTATAKILIGDALVDAVSAAETNGGSTAGAEDSEQGGRHAIAATVASQSRLDRHCVIRGHCVAGRAYRSSSHCGRCRGRCRDG